MKKVFLGAAAIAAIALSSCTKDLVPSQKLKTQSDSVAYLIGTQFAPGVISQFENIPDSTLNKDAFILGLVETMKKAEPTCKMTDEEVEEFLTTYFDKLRENNLPPEFKAMRDSIKAEGEKFLADKKAGSEYKVTSSGLLYKVIKEGDGKMPAATDMVRVHYEGKLMDGTVFDSSKRRGEPAEFPLDRVIKGWSEGLQLMKEGSVYELVIPYELAYGERGNAGIPPCSPLVFEVELIEVMK